MHFDFHSGAYEILAEALGSAVVPLSEVSKPPIASCETVEFLGDDFAFCLMDVNRDIDGKFRLIEMNGSNGGGADKISLGGETPRTEHFTNATLYKTNVQAGGVVIVGYAPGTALVAEHIERARMIAERFANSVNDVQFMNANGRPRTGSGQLTVIVDNIPKLASQMVVESGLLRYQGHRILAMSNANFLPELERIGVLDRNNGRYPVDVSSLFHDGVLAELSHDRELQQKLCYGSQFSAQRCYSAPNWDAAVATQKELSDQRRSFFGKINGGSGGKGIRYFDADLPMEIRLQKMTEMLNECADIYGSVATAYPIRFFEFTPSSGYPLGDGEHLWDLRLMCLIQPGSVQVYPVSFRLCPEPFHRGVGGDLPRDSIVCNVTGRNPSGRYLRVPMAPQKNGSGFEFELAGFTGPSFRRLLRAAGEWCSRAVFHMRQRY